VIKSKQLDTIIPYEMAGYRLDKALADLFPNYSRARLQQWIGDGQVRVNNVVKSKNKEKVQGGEKVELTAQLEESVLWQAQNLPLNIVFEDENLLIINKSAGVVVHPAAGNRENTLVNALLHHAPELAQIPRAGIIHRLDKDTTGLLVVARTLTAHTHLVAQLQARKFLKEYQAIVMGNMIAGGTVDAAIGRHPIHRTKMAVIPNGKSAVTHYRIIQRYRAHTHIRVILETGRTHQIRVHLAHIAYPLVGDPVYGKRLQIPANSSTNFANILRNFKRQALHAYKLGFIHPATGQFMHWAVDLPEDMQNLQVALESDKNAQC